MTQSGLLKKTSFLVTGLIYVLSIDFVSHYSIFMYNSIFKCVFVVFDMLILDMLV